MFIQRLPPHVPLAGVVEGRHLGPVTATPRVRCCFPAQLGGQHAAQDEPAALQPLGDRPLAQVETCRHLCQG